MPVFYFLFMFGELDLETFTGHLSQNPWETRWYWACMLISNG